MKIDKSEIGGVILAGGKASRMDFRDKALLPLHGEPLLAHVIRNAKPQVQRLLLSVNHNDELYQSFELPIAADHDTCYRGPLLGIYSAMHWFLHAQDDRTIKYLACFPGDVPQFPENVISELACSMNGDPSGVAYIVHQGQIQPLFSLWHLGLIDTVFDAIGSGLYGPKLLFEAVGAIAVLSNDDRPGAFLNINTSEDLEAASHLVTKHHHLS